MKQIKTLAQLIKARENKRAVICDAYCFCKPRPAAFMANLSGEILHRLMTAGMWIYDKPKVEK
jgi:hypothetical protein